MYFLFKKKINKLLKYGNKLYLYLCRESLDMHYIGDIFYFSCFPNIDADKF